MVLFGTHAATCDRVVLVLLWQGEFGYRFWGIGWAYWEAFDWYSFVRLQHILERVSVFSFESQHIPGAENKFCGAFNRLHQSVPGYSLYYPSWSQRLLDLSKKLCKRVKQLEYMDPMVQKNILKKSPPHLTQLQISELMFAHESRDTE